MVYVFKLKNYKIKLKMNMCKIYIGSKQNFLFASELQLEHALQLALNLHRSSNVAHTIDVYEDDRLVCSFKVSQ